MHVLVPVCARVPLVHVCMCNFAALVHVYMCSVRVRVYVYVVACVRVDAVMRSCMRVRV